jgi:aminopeptidase-like protein
VEQRGAAGLITDFVLQDEHVRERHDQSDTLRYTSFWWKPNQKKAFGFVISPREGDKLAALCEEMKAKKEKILIRCKVDSSIYPGHIEDVMAFLPGKTEEEILLVGHLCHPRSSANDNASGSSCCMEAMLTLKQMLDEGVLPPLQRGIRMLLVPEFTGTYAYLDRIGDKVKNLRAAFNLDMVGGRQDHGYGPITITDLPLSTPSFVSDAAGTVLDEIKRQVVGMMPESYCPLWNSHMTEYSGGSDHVVLSDPKTNVPCLMMGQWPDKYYHTSTDTLDRVDPYILSRSAALAAGYAYGLANLEPADVGDICNTGLQRAGVYLTDLQTKMTRGTLDPRFYKGRVQLYTKWRLDSIDTYSTWLDVDRSELEAEKARVTALVRAICGFDPLRPVKTIVTRRQAEKYSLVASRVKNVPVMMNKLQNMFDEKTNAEIDAFCARYMGVLGHAVSLAVDYRIDGRRTTAEIARDIAYEFGVYVPEAIDAYVRMLIKLNYAQEVK